MAIPKPPSDGDDYPGRSQPLTPPVQSAFHQWQKAEVKLKRQRSQHPDDSDAVRDANREFWQATLRVIEEAQGSEDEIRRGTPASLPTPVATILRRALNHLLSGNHFEPFDDLITARQGTRPATPREENDKRCAAAYVLASKEGIVNDRSPIKTVMGRFGVGRSTVQSWSRVYSDATPDGVYPDAEPKVRARLITSRMELAGDRYAQAGRSQAAIQKRASKKARCAAK